MNFLYIISIICLMTLFLLYRKGDKEICFVSSLFYSFGLLFCYNTVIVFLIYLLGIQGSILLYSIINYFIGTIILLIILRKKKIQKYCFDKKKLIVIFCVIVIVFLIGCFRYRGFEAISYESGDSAIHYTHAIKFSEELSILDENNSNDYVYGYFDRVMPISYVNCGFLFNILSGVKTYILFSYYNVFCLILSAIIFLITVMDLFNTKKKNYVFSIILTLFYLLAYPFNAFVMGFCYLGLNLMVINMIFLTFIHIRDNLTDKMIFKVIIIFLLTFGCFYSYYLFVPAVYLMIGIYYIYLWRNKKINFKELLIYGIFTLVIPFIIGFSYFLITWVIDSGYSNITTVLASWGYSYNNITPLYLFIFISTCYVCMLFKKKKINGFKISMSVISIYVALFLILYIFKITDSYYFYKIFSLYWLAIVLFFNEYIFKFRKIFYVFCFIMLGINIFVYNDSSSKFAIFMINSNIYTWNSIMMIDENIIFDENEVEIMEESIKYQDQCMNNDNYKFLVLGDVLKNIWYYSVTKTVPVLGDVKDNKHNLYLNLVPDVTSWYYGMKEYNCLVYYYEDEKVELNESMIEILYSNDSGAIIKRK